MIVVPTVKARRYAGADTIYISKRPGQTVLSCRDERIQPCDVGVHAGLVVLYMAVHARRVGTGPRGIGGVGRHPWPAAAR